MKFTSPLRRNNSGTRVKHRKPLSSSVTRRRPLFETLESRRVLAAYTWSDFDATLVIRLATSESLTVTEAGGTATFSLSAGTFTNVGGDSAPGDGTTAIAIPTDDLTDSIAIDNTISSGGVTNVVFNGSGSLTSISFEVELIDPDSVGTIAMQGDFSLISQGAGGLAFTTGQGVFLDTGTSISTVDGDINLQGNADGSSSGNFNGVIINGTLTSTGAGDIIAIGHGANASGIDRQRGIFVFGGQIHSTGTGEISLSGVGGNGGTSNNVGISLESNAQITSVAGDISFNGIGGNGSADSNLGFVMVSGATVSATGAANINVTGTGGAGTDQNAGVAMTGVGVGISAVNGNIEITGTATDATGSFPIGVWLFGSPTITTTSSGNIAITGETAAPTAAGIQLDSAAITLGGQTITLIADRMSFVGGASINAGTGSVALATETTNGSVGINIGGSDSATQLGLSNAELNLITAGLIVIGDKGTPNTITVSGAIQHGGDADFGILTARNTVIGSGASWTTTDGDLNFEANRELIATAGNFVGISLDAATLTTSGEGNILLQGRGGSAGFSNHGINLSAGAVIHSTSAASGAGTIGLDGVGGNSGSINLGIQMDGNGTIVSSIAGDILINGRGGGDGTGHSNYGVRIDDRAVVSSTGIGATAATITIHGVGGAGTATNVGVYITDSGTQIFSTSGNIAITGEGGGSGSGEANFGVWVQDSVVISSTGTDSSAASIAIHGTGGNGIHEQTGVFIVTNSSINSLAGPIQITATAGGNSQPAFVLGSSSSINVNELGTVTLIADSMHIVAAINAAQSTVNLLPQSAGRIINLGGPDSATELGLTDEELDFVMAGVLAIGDGNSGDIEVTADIIRGVNTTVVLQSSGDILITGGQINTAGGDLLLNAPVPPSEIKPTKAGVDATVDNALLDSDLGIAIDGTMVDADYNQLNVVGTVNLQNANLQLSGGYVPQPGDVFTIVSATEVTGQFNLLGDGDKITFNGVELVVDYTDTTVTLAALRDAGDIIVLGAEAGAQPRVKVLNAQDGSEIVSFLAYNSSFAGGVRVAVADMNGDGQAEIIVAPGAGISTLVKVFDLEGNELLDYRTKAYLGFSGGVFVATGDVNGDGRPDLITSPGVGLSSQIKVFKNRTGIVSPNPDPISNNPIYAFLAFGGTFTGGATVAAGNLTGDGRAEIVVGNGPGMGPRVRVFDVSQINPPVSTNLAPFALEIRPFDTSDRGGVFVAVGDVRGDATQEIIIGNGTDGRGRVEMFNANGTRFNSFTAYNNGEGRNAPVHVATKNVDVDAVDEILTGQGAPGSIGQLRTFDSDGTLIDDLFEGEDDFRFGFFVA